MPRSLRSSSVAIFPHLIPAATIPNGGLERALTESRDKAPYVSARPRRVVLGPPKPGSYRLDRLRPSGVFCVQSARNTAAAIPSPGSDGHTASR